VAAGRWMHQVAPENAEAQGVIANPRAGHR